MRNFFIIIYRENRRTILDNMNLRFEHVKFFIFVQVLKNTVSQWKLFRIVSIFLQKMFMGNDPLPSEIFCVDGKDIKFGKLFSDMEEL